MPHLFRSRRVATTDMSNAHGGGRVSVPAALGLLPVLALACILAGNWMASPMEERAVPVSTLELVDVEPVQVMGRMSAAEEEERSPELHLTQYSNFQVAPVRVSSTLVCKVLKNVVSACVCACNIPWCAEPCQ